ncbi:beta-aspartyl-peptidase [candidate division GN15 bacterium]|nr:beta-aspartyl-peptidase [candidate division GN15 bacterium]
MTDKYTPAIAIHGGAGTIMKTMMTDEKEKAYRDKLTESLQAGYAVLKEGGPAIDAVLAAVRVMEDSPLFNAGKGAVFTHEGENEQDACICDGNSRNVGAVAAVRRIASPIMLARLVLDRSPHVLLSGEGAETFAQEHGIELVDKEYFHTDFRWNQLQQAIRREKKAKAPQTQLDHSHDKDAEDENEKEKMGTVGAVAVDSRGDLAAATSTGGMTNKRYGRIGDTPMIGAGTYADNATCAVSATGVGEFFMRCVTGFDMAAMMLYKKMSLHDAAEWAVMQKLKEMGGSGGVIAIDRSGNIAMPFNTPGMYRGWMKSEDDFGTALYQE